jgi:hypothetical protein
MAYPAMYEDKWSIHTNAVCVVIISIAPDELVLADKCNALFAYGHRFLHTSSSPSQREFSSGSTKTHCALTSHDNLSCLSPFG